MSDLLTFDFSKLLGTFYPLKGTGSRLRACSLMKLLLSNLLLILSVNNPTHMYLSDLRVYFKVELYSDQSEVGWRSTKIAEKNSGLCQH